MEQLHLVALTGIKLKSHDKALDTSNVRIVPPTLLPAFNEHKPPLEPPRNSKSLIALRAPGFREKESCKS